MRTTDPQLMTQIMLGHQTGGKYQAIQHVGSYLGYVVDNHTNNSDIQEGTLKFVIPHFNNTAGWPAAPFPGVVEPPIGTQCVITFEGPLGNQPRVTTFVDWQSPRVSVSSTDPTGTSYYHNGYTPVEGDFWVDTSA